VINPSISGRFVMSKAPYGFLILHGFLDNLNSTLKCNY
jgi:hypothetical protein